MVQRLVILVVLASCLGTSALSQSINCTRTSFLQDGVYQMEGTAYLERFEGGALQLRLGDDFDTDVGPDVQIFLSNDSTSTAGGIMIADIGTGDGISHFRGAITFDVPGNVEIDEYAYIVFRCVSFNAFWGGGKWSDSTCGDGNGMQMDSTVMATCFESSVATTGWVSEVSICPNDGVDDVVPFVNSLGAVPGQNYSYLIVDANNNIQNVIETDSYNFEGSSFETQYVFGVYHIGSLSFMVGSSINSISADTCLQLSSSSLFLTVNKSGCATSFQCVPTITATTGWETTVDICPGDGEPDVIPFINNESQVPGPNYAYIITDDQENIEKVHFADTYDFDDSGTGINFVYGISYSGSIQFMQGDHISTITADSCFILSDSSFFLTVLKSGCPNMQSFRDISGQVTNGRGEGISGISIRYLDDQNVTTDGSGNFTIEEVATDQDIVLTPHFNEGAANGVSSTDLVLTTRHILGLNPFMDPLQLIAADANNNGSISASDLVTIKRVLLNQSPEFLGNTSWRFISADQLIDLNILNGSIEQSIMIPAGAEDVSEINFIGIKIGDVNGNANLSN